MYVINYFLFPIKLKLAILFLAGSVSLMANENPKTIMLILGSGNLKTSVERAEIGFDLYKFRNDFDFIILSGGCGAHGSNICEASIMADVLIEKGVPEHLIIKEEKSKNTAQNYCYTRELLSPDGTKLINAGDRLFVVSNHWHAMSVSGCFNDRDLVNSSFVISGKSIPKADQKTDYNNIYKNCMKGPHFCEQVFWPKIDAAYTLPKSIKKGSPTAGNLILNEMTLNKNNGSDAQFELITQKIHSLPDFWQADIQAAFYNKFEKRLYLIKDRQILALKADSNQIEKCFPTDLATYFPEISPFWHQTIDAAFFDSKRKQLYFFKEDKFLRLTYQKKGKIKFEPTGNIVDLVQEWPFSWGSGHMDAAHYDAIADEVMFYRGQESLPLSFHNDKLRSKNQPQRLEIEWPVNLWGNLITF